MDIDDILASVSGSSIPAETLDLQALTRAWVAERTAPELLPYPTDLIERVTARLRKQVRLNFVVERLAERRNVLWNKDRRKSNDKG